MAKNSKKSDGARTHDEYTSVGLSGPVATIWGIFADRLGGKNKAVATAMVAFYMLKPEQRELYSDVAAILLTHTRTASVHETNLLIAQALAEARKRIPDQAGEEVS